MIESPYRPRNKGHDYSGRGIYLVTPVVSGRKTLPASLGEGLRLTPLGAMVEQAWREIPDYVPLTARQ